LEVLIGFKITHNSKIVCLQYPCE